MECKISVNGNILKQVNEVIYLESMFSRDGSYEMNVEILLPVTGLTEP